MGRYVSLLRGINVSGQKKIRMDELRALYASLGFADVASYRDMLKTRIESAILKQFGFAVEVFLRTLEELEGIVKKNPYAQELTSGPAGLYVTFLAAPPSPGALEGMRALSSGDDSYEISGSEIYLHCPGGYGRTKLSNNAIEKAAGIPATTRNWKTVNTLLKM